MKRVLIVGGGFGGVWAAKALRKAPVEVLVLDRRNHHVFQPLLYQVATASLSPADISAPIRTVLRGQGNCQVVMAEVRGVDVNNRRVLLDGGHVEYDYLILAAGATHAYFGHDEWAPIAPGLKSIEDATELRRRILLAFESAEYEGSEEARRALADLATRDSLTNVEIIAGTATDPMLPADLDGAFAADGRLAIGRASIKNNIVLFRGLKKPAN